MGELRTLARIAFRLAAHSSALSDKDLLARLLDLGIDRATARRIVVFAPIAAARVAYRDFVAFLDPDRYYLQSTESGADGVPVVGGTSIRSMRRGCEGMLPSAARAHAAA